jgi:hypothetical protein
MIRDATVGELQELALEPAPGYDRWVGVVEEEGAIVGHIVVDMRDGCAFGHSLESHAAGKRAAIELVRYAFDKVDALGIPRIRQALHIEDDESHLSLYKRLGFERRYTVYTRN